MRPSRWVRVTYAMLILLGIVTAFPNLLPQSRLDALPGWLPKQQVTLGLDLRGGSHLVLEIDSEALLQDRLQSLLDDATRSLRDAGIRPQSIGIAGTSLVASFLSSGDRDAAAPLLRGLAPPVQRGGFPTGSPSLEVAFPDATTLEVGLTEAGLRDRVDSAIEQSLEVVRQRVDQVGVAEPTIQRVGSDRILVQLPGLQDPARLRELLGSTARLSFHMLADGGESGDGGAFATMVLPDTDGQTRHTLQRRVAVSGEHLTDARAGFDQRSGEPVVSFRFDSVGARQFADITRSNVGRPFAIVLDGKVLSAPVIREPITGGSGQISGAFSVADTVTLSAMLRAGALPAPLTVIEERSVGPDLGSDAIRMGVATGLAGFALVVGFMVALYGGWGLIANLALGLNVTLTFGALSLLGATLTLPGIAGIILGIGLAVDANILINERIREETRKGASAVMALDRGFRRAYATIVDANVTTLLATALLFQFGSGPVRGFAITMMLGIGISMFTAIAVVRLAMMEVVRRRRLKTLVMVPPVRLARRSPAIPFMRARFFGIGLSLLLSAGSIALFVSPGLSYGIDFKGGIQMEVTTSAPAKLADLRSALGGLGLGEVTLQSFGDDHTVLIRVERQAGGEAAQSSALQSMRAALQGLDPGATIDRTEVVGPKISAELARSGIIAVLLASLAMLGYIWWRFEWHFAVGAIATLVLDVTKTVGFFALTGLDFNLTAIAALLTIIGYSVNDKVVVYDRMRENLRLYKAMPLRQLIDMSINQVLARCLFTSATTLLAMLPMAIWGGGTVSSFAIPMVFGVVIATSSSLFIAAPILLLLGNWRQRRLATATATPAEVLPAPGP